MNYFALLKAVHVLCAVLWVGGMFFAYVVLRPSLAVLEPPQRLALHAQVFRRFFLVVWHAMPLIILTGLVMMFRYYGGMEHVTWAVHAMMGLGLIMAAVFIAIFFGPYRRFRRSNDRPAMAAAVDSIRKLIGINLILGLLTVAIAMYG
jgi:uncharacterized membrane protein